MVASPQSLVYEGKPVQNYVWLNRTFNRRLASGGCQATKGALMFCDLATHGYKVSGNVLDEGFHHPFHVRPQGAVLGSLGYRLTHGVSHLYPQQKSNAKRYVTTTKIYSSTLNHAALQWTTCVWLLASISLPSACHPGCRNGHTPSYGGQPQWYILEPSTSSRYLHMTESAVRKSNFTITLPLVDSGDIGDLVAMLDRLSFKILSPLTGNRSASKGERRLINVQETCTRQIRVTQKMQNHVHTIMVISVAVMLPL